MSLASWALRQRAFVLLALLLLAAAGLYSARALPAGIYPEVDFPRIVVVARGGDSPPEVFQSAVTRPLEQALATTLGVQRIRSRTVRGAAELSLLFAPGTEMNRALQLVQTQASNARASLPAGVELELERLTPTAFPVVTFNLAGRADGALLRDVAELVVRPALSRVPGVGLVRVVGGDAREVSVVLDPERAAALRLRPQEVALRLRERLSLGGGGRVERGSESLAAVLSGEAQDLEALRAVPLASAADGSPVPLGRVARVFAGHADRAVRVGGPEGETVVLSVSRAEGASTTAVVDEALRVARELAPSLPAGLTLRPVYDQAGLVEQSLHSVRDAIALGVALCLLVLGVSLRDARAGLLAALVVPFVLAATFLVLRLTGQTLNLMSLGGMAVAVGLVIDDAIIVVEAIARRLDEGLSPEEAARKGTGELTAAVLGTTATTVLVFAPLARLEGLLGSFFVALAGTLSAAVVLSMVVSLTAVPAAAALLLRPRAARERASRLDRYYAAVAAWGARRRWLGAALVLLSLAGCAALASRVQSGFLPALDEGAFVLDYFLPAGTSLAETERVARELERVLAATPEVERFARRTGAELGPAAATTMNRGDLMVRLRGSRRRSTEAVVEDVRARVAAEVPRARVEFVLVLADVLNDLSGTPRPVEVKLFGEEQATLERLAAEVATRLRRVRGLADLSDGLEPPTGVLRYEVDHLAASRLHLSSQVLLDTLSAGLAGASGGSYRWQDRLLPVRVRYPDAVRFAPERLLESPLLLDTPGAAVPLGSVLRLHRQRLRGELAHEDLLPVLSLTADVEGRDLGSVDRDVRAALAGLSLPPGYRLEVGGQASAQREAFASTAWVGAGGLLLTLLVLALQFRALRPSLAVLATAPLAVAGALLTLWLTGTRLDVSSAMGFVLLVGLEVKAGILLLEEAQLQARRGAPPERAVAEASARRIRPIMLTTTATLAGVAPLAAGLGAGTEVLRPLALVVLGGIAISKFLNLAALPSLALLFGLGAAPEPRGE